MQRMKFITVLLWIISLLAIPAFLLAQDNLSELSEYPPILASGYPDGVKSETYSDIFVIQADGSSRRNLTKTPSLKEAFADWSPDRSKVVYRAHDPLVRPINVDIYVINADGSNRRKLTNHPARDFGPVWSPDGSQIAFYSNRTGGTRIFLMNSDGSNLRQLTDFDSWSPEWSPDGRKIAFVSSALHGGAQNEFEIYVMNADGSNPVRLTYGGGVSPAWSPDGSKIAFYDQRRPRSDADDIYVMNADGSQLKKLTSTPAGNSAKTSNFGEYDFLPAWSPDGKKICFISSRDKDNDYEVFVMNADGTNIIQVTKNDMTEGAPDW